MALSSDYAPPPPRQSIRDIKRAMRNAELSPATWITQVAVYAQIVLAIGLFCAWLDASVAFAATSIALALGVLVGVLTPIGALFRNLSGVVVALAAVFVTIVLLGFTDGRLFGEEPVLIAAAVGLAALGLDWSFVPRLRARAVASGLLVVPLIGAGETWALAGAVGWTAGLLATLWLAERDVRAAALRPVPLTDAPADSRASVWDIVRAAGVGLAIGLVAAMLFGDATCSFRRDESPTEVGRPDQLGPAGGPDQGYLGIDGLGRSFVTGPDGSRTYVEDRGAVTELRDELGNLRAEITDDDITVYGPNGDSQTYQRNDDGGLTIEGPDGEDYTVEPEASGWVLRNEAGEIVTRTDRSNPNQLPSQDSNGDLLVPDDNRDGRMPVPDRAVSPLLLDPDRDRVYEGDSSGQSSGSGPASESGQASAAGGADAPRDDGPGTDVPWELIGLAIVAAAAVAGLFLWLRRDRGSSEAPPTGWADRLARRLADEGRQRGRARGRGETVLDHSAALASGPLPDPRVATVGQVLSSALFARREPSPDTQQWAESVVDEVSSAHPPPTRREERRRGRAQRRTTTP